jgi:putative zinc finger protein
VVSCKQVLRELSNYIDQTVDAELRAEIENHLRACHRCSVILDSTKKTIRIYSDEGVLNVPAGYSARLREFFLNVVKR